MPTDTQDHQRRMKALQEAFTKVLEETYSAPEIILIKKEFYAILEKDRMDSIGWIYPAMQRGHKDPRTYRGAKIYLAEDFEIETDFVFMTKEAFTYFKERQVMFYRLMTNGEWHAQGKTPEQRKEILMYEAEGFADMCSGYGAWRRMYKEYLRTYPKPPQD